MKCIVTKAFQYKGSNYAGKVLDLSEEELKDPFIARHVEQSAASAPRDAQPTYFGNGTAKSATRETPAATAADDAAELTLGQLRAKLAKLGVHYTNKQSAEDLAALYRQAQEAVAGSPLAPNRPTA